MLYAKDTDASIPADADSGLRSGSVYHESIAGIAPQVTK